MKLKSKLIITFIAVLILMSLAQAAYFHNRMLNNFDTYLSKNMLQEINLWSEMLTDYYAENGGWEGLQQVISDVNPRPQMRPGGGPGHGQQGSFNMHNRLRIAVADPRGTIIADSDNLSLGTDIGTISGVKRDITLSGKKVGEAVFISRNQSGLMPLEQEFKKSMFNSLFIGLLISLLAAILIGIFFSERITKPLQQLLEATKRLTKGDHSYRIELEQTGEFQELADAYNEMAEQLAANEENRKNLLADVAHELRTPISIIAGELELVQEGTSAADSRFFISMADEVQRLNRLVSDLRQVSLAEAGQLNLNLEKTNVYQLLERVIDNFSWAEEEQQLKITLTGDEEITALIDSDRFKQVIINLLGNSIHHLGPGGLVEVGLEEIRPVQQIKITITDNGPGIAGDQLPHIFDRFYRTDSSRSRDEGGTGLGLSIVKSYVEAHGGIIQVESELNQGTRFIISIPQ